LRPARCTNVGRLDFFALHSELVSGLKTCTFLNTKLVKKEKEVRIRKVTMRMNNIEYGALQLLFKESTCRLLSEYLRKVSLKKPVKIKYWNASADEILTALFQLKSELNAIGNNFNQVVHKLHTLDRIPEFRSWIETYESSRQSIEKKIKETETWMHQFFEQWSQK
jgi:vacuolar-type H+-ATPase subunit D/Vma8